MPIRNEAQWKTWAGETKFPSNQGCIERATMIMAIIDTLDIAAPLNAQDLLREVPSSKTDGIPDEFLDAVVSTMISVCHTRGEEFRKSRDDQQNQREIAEIEPDDPQL